MTVRRLKAKCDQLTDQPTDIGIKVELPLIKKVRERKMAASLHFDSRIRNAHK